MTPELAQELIIGFFAWLGWSLAACLAWSEARKDETRRQS